MRIVLLMLVALQLWAPVLDWQHVGTPTREIFTEAPPIPAIAETPARPDTYDGVPGWVVRGIAFTESRSYFGADGTITYVDRRRGKDGEVGAFQTMPNVVEGFSTHTPQGAHRNPETSRQVACRYLVSIYRSTGRRSWSRTVRQYNVGPYGDIQSPRAIEYLKSVTHNGRRVPTR